MAIDGRVVEELGGLVETFVGHGSVLRGRGRGQESVHFGTQRAQRQRWGHMRRPRVVIVGAGFGGIAAARGAGGHAGRRHDRRPAQLPHVLAAAVPGRDRRASRPTTSRRTCAASCGRAPTSRRGWPRCAASTSNAREVLVDDGAADPLRRPGPRRRRGEQRLRRPGRRRARHRAQDARRRHAGPQHGAAPVRGGRRRSAARRRRHADVRRRRRRSDRRRAVRRAGGAVHEGAARRTSSASTSAGRGSCWSR